jgi:iron complex transport system substrate-binding protein
MRKTILVLVLAASLLIAAGCQVQNPTVTTAPLAAPDTFPLTLADASGQPVTIPEKPQAVIATSVWAGEILLDLLDASRIKGLSAWGDDPAVSATAEKAKAVPARVKTGEPEGIVALKPDLVIIDTFSDPEGALARTLSEAGAVVLHWSSPTDFTQIKQAITALAAATGETARGQALIGEMEDRLQAVADRLGSLPQSQMKKVIYYEDYYDPSGASAGMLAAYGQGTPFAAVAAAAGLVNVCDAPKYSAISKEKVVGEWRPDMLVVPGVTYNPDFTATDDQGKSMIAAVLADPLLQTLPAVQSGQVIAITEKYRGSTSHYMAYAVSELAAKAYPELFQP